MNRKNNIAFKNLRAEMGRNNIGIKDIAEVCGFNRDTLARKLSKKTPLNLDEAFRFQIKKFVICLKKRKSQTTPDEGSEVE